MLDIKLFRTNSKKIIEKLKAKNYDDEISINNIVKFDIELRNLKTNESTLNAKRNLISDEIRLGFKNNLAGTKIEFLKNEVKTIKGEIEKITLLKNNIETEIENIINYIPNLCSDDVPVGKDEKANALISKYLEPTKFDFEPLAHWDLAEKLDLFKLDVAAKITGSKFVTYWDKGARLHRALCQYTLDQNINAGFKEILPQSIINSNSLYGTGQLPKFEDDLFKLTDTNYYLSPTAEVQLTNIYANEIINENELPIYLTANTSCFRKEAGSAGRDTRGVIRLHQFQKTELVKIVSEENSNQELESLTKQAESILKNLELPYQKILLCTGDTGFSASKTYDLEVWLPSDNGYKEISSCSNCLDFQARRAKIRYRNKNKEIKYPHTLNGSSLAIDRLFVAVLENYQTKCGNIKIPNVLLPYMNGLEII